MTQIVWIKETQPYSPKTVWQAYSGSVYVGFTLCASVNNPDKKWVWQITVLSGRKLQGSTRSYSDSRRALAKRWAKWLDDAGLSDCGTEARTKEAIEVTHA